MEITTDKRTLNRLFGEYITIKRAVAKLEKSISEISEIVKNSYFGNEIYVDTDSCYLASKKDEEDESNE